MLVCGFCTFGPSQASCVQLFPIFLLSKANRLLAPVTHLTCTRVPQQFSEWAYFPKCPTVALKYWHLTKHGSQFLLLCQIAQAVVLIYSEETHNEICLIEDSLVPILPVHSTEVSLSKIMTLYLPQRPSSFAESLLRKRQVKHTYSMHRLTRPYLKYDSTAKSHRC